MPSTFKMIGLCAATLCLGVCTAGTQTAPAKLHYQRIVLSAEPVEQPLLTGPPQTAGMRAGRVVLKAGEDMHRHSTENNEELLVFLRGKARVLLGSETLTMEAGQVLYIPPQTEHELHNDGPDELRYIYTVAPAGR
jgi:mannose-6-phosphate isomerase-like protein (cupin superfamily)